MHACSNVLVTAKLTEPRLPPHATPPQLDPSEEPQDPGGRDQLARAVCASLADALVIVAPDGRHASNDSIVSKESYQVRPQLPPLLSSQPSPSQRPCARPADARQTRSREQSSHPPEHHSLCLCAAQKRAWCRAEQVCNAIMLRCSRGATLIPRVSSFALSARPLHTHTVLLRRQERHLQRVDQRQGRHDHSRRSELARRGAARLRGRDDLLVHTRCPAPCLLTPARG